MQKPLYSNIPYRLQLYHKHKQVSLCTTWHLCRFQGEPYTTFILIHPLHQNKHPAGLYWYILRTHLGWRFDKMLIAGVVKPVHEVTPWINSFVLVETKDKVLRSQTVDLSRPNQPQQSHSLWIILLLHPWGYCTTNYQVQLSSWCLIVPRNTGINH